MPIGGFASSSDIFKVFKSDPPLNHVTTFGGHPVSCAAGNAALLALFEKKYIDNASIIESQIKEHLQMSGIIEIRGKGAMLGMQLQNIDLTEKVVMHCFKEGLILGWTLHSNTLVRLAPPLTIPENVLFNAINVIKSAIKLYT